MSQRIRELLDEAVAGIAPRNADPAPAVIRRGRAARARAVAASGLALVAVLTGGAVAGARLLEGPSHEAGAAPTATRPERPPTPRLVKGRIIADAMSIAPPKGWQVLPLAPTTSCGFKRQTVLIGEGANPHGPSPWCTTAEIEVLSTFDFLPYDVVQTEADPTSADGWQRSPFVPPRMSTLDGGEPVWLRTDADGVYRLVLPWSRVEIKVRGGADVRQQVLDTLHTGHWVPEALVLPEATGYAALTMSTDAGGARKEQLTDSTKVLRARELLREAAVVEQGTSCAHEDQPTVELEIGKPGDSPGLPGETGSFVIGLADGCHEVVAEEGGRARLDAAGLAELGDIFGVQLP
jgi:hypothetical protein